MGLEGQSSTSIFYKVRMSVFFVFCQREEEIIILLTLHILIEHSLIALRNTWLIINLNCNTFSSFSQRFRFKFVSFSFFILGGGLFGFISYREVDLFDLFLYFACVLPILYLIQNLYEISKLLSICSGYSANLLQKCYCYLVILFNEHLDFILGVCVLGGGVALSSIVFLVGVVS